VVAPGCGLAPSPAEGTKATKPPDGSAKTVFSYWLQVGLTTSGNAPLSRLQVEPGSCVTTGRGSAADGDGERDGAGDAAIAEVADAVADAVADGLSNGPAGEFARKLP
jgi:hypothetical protein